MKLIFINSSAESRNISRNNESGHIILDNYISTGFQDIS